MKTALIFGSGQVGAMIARLLGADYSALAFADNYAPKWNTALLGLKVLPPEEGLKLNPDAVFLGVRDKKRMNEMESQLHKLGYSGEIIRPDILDVFDARRATLRLLAEQITNGGIEGDVAELGVYKGEFAVLINSSFPDRTLHLFDTFEGFSESDVNVEKEHGFSKAEAGDFSDTSADFVKSRLPIPENAEFHKGFFPGSFAGCENNRFAFVSVDADLYTPTAAALPVFWDRLNEGGALMIHDANGTQFPGVRKAVNEFCKERRVSAVPVCDLHGSVILIK